MTQAIDPVKLKAAAEHLEWVLQQYPENEDVQGLLHTLQPLIEDAKAGHIKVPVDSGEVPGAYNFSDGIYIPFKQPSVEEAYTDFRRELKGGLTEQDRRIIARIVAIQESIRGVDGHD